MSFNGSGTFVINSTGQPIVNGTTATDTVMNALTADLATGLTTCITKDGQTTTTALVTFAQGISTASVTNSTGLAHGTYTPTISNTTNIAVSAAQVTHYVRVGNQVFGGGKITLRASAASGVGLNISLPIASNFTVNTDAAGNGSSQNADVDMTIDADTANDAMTMTYIALDTSSANFFFQFIYTVK